MNTITRAIDTIEVGSLKNDEPILLDLNQIFGAIGLTYKVAVESYGVVSVRKSEGSAKLYLTAGEFAERGCSSRLVIRADDGTGCSASVTYKIKVTQSSDASRVA